MAAHRKDAHTVSTTTGLCQLSSYCWHLGEIRNLHFFSQQGMKALNVSCFVNGVDSIENLVAT